MENVGTRTCQAILSFTAMVLSASLFGQWEPLATGLQSVRSVTTMGNAIYAAHYPVGISKSTNDGVTWAPVNSGITATGGNTFVQSVGHNATYLFAGTQSGVYRSNNGGTSWTNINGSLTASSTVYVNKWFHFGIATFGVFTGTIANGGGIARTNDNGTTWLIGHSGMGSNVTVYHMTDDGTKLYAATSTGLYTSVDGGQQWSAVSGSNFAIYSVQKVGTRLIIISSFGYRYSDNGGSTWTDATGDIASPTKGELIAYDGKLFAVTGTNNGCLVSLDNGATYSPFNTGLSPVDAISQEEFHASGATLYMGALTDLYKLPGSTVGITANGEEQLPRPYPTLFTNGFTVDLTGMDAGASLILMDAAGREAARLDNVPSGPVVFERGALVAGTYTCLHRSAIGEQHVLGTVIAQ
ncbi:MAG: hypothetical protein R2815_11780 [Flavobacteriales bacterium]